MVKHPASEILLLYSATGNGHRSVAWAIRDSIEEISDAHISEIEVFAAVRLPLINRWPTAYSWMATRSVWLYNALFFITDKYSVSMTISKAIYAFSKHRINRILKHANPDIVVVTAPFICQIIAQARRELGADFRIVNVVSDLITPHASWACRESDLTVTFTPLAKHRLISTGAGGRRIIQGDFPVQREFRIDAPRKEECRRTLGLQADRFTIVLSGGSLGAGPVLATAKALYKIFPTIQLLIVAGHNDRLHKALRSQFNEKRVRVYGFTEQMANLVRASDLVVCKGGPSSIMESRAAGRPIIIVAEVGSQERGNGDWAQHLRIGFHARSIDELIAIIESLQHNPGVQETETQVSTSGNNYDDIRDIGKLILEHSIIESLIS